jgi:hypothetical protein
MKELVVPVPETVSATYVVPVPAPMSTVEARRQASKAVNARLTGPLRTLTAEWLAKGAVKVEMEPAGTPPPGLLDKPLFGTPEQRVFLSKARTFVRFSAAQRASLIGVQEWKARGPVGAENLCHLGRCSGRAQSRVQCRASRSWPVWTCDDLRLVGLKLIFLAISSAMSLLRSAGREQWWKDAEILMLRHQLAVACASGPGLLQG